MKVNNVPRDLTWELPGDLDDPIRMGCRPDDCSDRQKLMRDGTCQLCLDYTKPFGMYMKTECQPDNCYENQILLRTGFCETCPEFKKPDT